MRVFGTGLGVATDSSVLAWRIELMTGLHERTVEAPQPVLLAAIRDVMLARRCTDTVRALESKGLGLRKMRSS